jgi:hypothetical protein
MVSLEVCKTRKTEKRHGCVTCAHPSQVLRDNALTAMMAVGIDLGATGKAKRERYYVRGLTLRPIRMSRRVAQELYNQLGRLLASSQEP